MSAIFLIRSQPYDLLFPADRVAYIPELLKVDEPVQFVVGTELGSHSLLVLPDAA